MNGVPAGNPECVVNSELPLQFVIVTDEQGWLAIFHGEDLPLIVDGTGSGKFVVT